MKRLTPTQKKWLAAAAGAGAAWWLWKRERTSPQHDMPSVYPWGAGWTWPVPTFHTPGPSVYPAVISQEWRASSTTLMSPITGSTRGHYGVDVMFHTTDINDPIAALYSPVLGYFAPPGTPILAANDGVIWSADKSARGYQIVIDHGKPWATYYQHLAELAVPLHANGKGPNGTAPTPVRAGDVIGTMGADPTDAEHLRHLHFAVWYQGHGDAASVAIDETIMNAWARQDWAPPVLPPRG